MARPVAAGGQHWCTGYGKMAERRVSSAVSARLASMAFGQSAGSPATARQVQELLELLHLAGHSDFRDARGPMGFTQRQAGGKFSRDEAAAFIERLQQEAELEPGPDTAHDAGATSAPVPVARPKSAEQALRRIPTEHLAAELQRRGWIVVEP